MEAFNETVTKMEQVSKEAKEWLFDNAPKEHWAELYFEGKRYGHYTSNIVESLNSWILEARELPILPMFETIRHQLMDWFAERSQLETHTMGLLVKDASNRIQTMVNTRARRYHIWTVDQVEYEIQSHNGEAIHEYLVNLVDRTCTCHAFQALGIPCAHALACIIYRKEDPQMYAASFYHLDSFRQTYAQTIVHCRRKQPMAPLVELLPPQELDELNFHGSSESEDSSSDNGILPPVVRRPPDRPSNA